MCIGIRSLVIRSQDEVDVNKWTKLSVSRHHNEFTLRVGDAVPIMVKDGGPSRNLFLKIPLYVGGYDKRIVLGKGVEVNRGFDGCISGVSYIKISCFSIMIETPKIFVFNCSWKLEHERLI